MKSITSLLLVPIVAVAALAPATPALATGLATCVSESEDDWQPQETLQQRLEEQGWEVRRIKVDGGCYEVYALDAEGERVEAYFHPVTLTPVAAQEDEGD